MSITVVLGAFATAPVALRARLEVTPSINVRGADRRVGGVRRPARTGAPVAYGSSVL